MVFLRKDLPKTCSINLICQLEGRLRCFSRCTKKHTASTPQIRPSSLVRFERLLTGNWCPGPTECREFVCVTDILTVNRSFRANRDETNLILGHRSSFVTLCDEGSLASRDTGNGLCKPPSTYLVLLLQLNPLHGIQRNTTATEHGKGPSLPVQGLGYAYPA